MFDGHQCMDAHAVLWIVDGHTHSAVQSYAAQQLANAMQWWHTLQLCVLHMPTALKAKFQASCLSKTLAHRAGHHVQQQTHFAGHFVTCIRACYAIVAQL